MGYGLAAMPGPVGACRQADGIRRRFVVSQADADRFAADAFDAIVMDVDADHYSILIHPPAIQCC